MSTWDIEPRHISLGLSVDEYRKLPHPTRLKTMMAEFADYAKTNALAAEMISELKSRHQSMNDVADIVQLTNPVWVRNITSDGSDFHTAFASTAVPMRHHVAEGRLFTVGPELSEILFNTEVSDDVPCEMLRAPFHSCYLHFPEALSECPLLATDGKKVRMLGCYVQETVIEEGVDIAQVPSDRATRSLMLTFIGEGESTDPDDDTLRFLTLNLSKDDAKLSTVLADSFERMKEYDRGLGFSALPGYFESYERAMHHIVRVLLYMNCATVRMETHKPASELEAQIKRVGPSKQPKLKRKLAKLYDFIEICAPHIERPAGTGAGSSGAARATHWRRGHLRNQAHGPQFSLRKLIFLPPTLVAGSRTVAGEVPVRDYHVN